jgi:hypothetical protein
MTRRQILEKLKSQGINTIHSLKMWCREVERFQAILEVRHGA